MKLDSVQQYRALRASLIQEKARLEARLAAINGALADADAPARRVGRPPGAPRGRARAANSLSLREAVTKVTQSKPLTKPEILKSVGSVGYKFTARDPMNSLNTMLYTPGNFKKHPGGKWGPLKK